MSESRQKSDWVKVGIAVAWLVNRNGWTKEAISPADVIPEAYRPEAVEEVPKTPEQVEEESRIAWRLLDQYFTNFATRR